MGGYAQTQLNIVLRTMKNGIAQRIAFAPVSRAHRMGPAELGRACEMLVVGRFPARFIASAMNACYSLRIARR
jgi:hypothetical protein